MEKLLCGDPSCRRKAVSTSASGKIQAIKNIEEYLHFKIQWLYKNFKIHSYYSYVMLAMLLSDEE